MIMVIMMIQEIGKALPENKAEVMVMKRMTIMDLQEALIQEGVLGAWVVEWDLATEEVLVRDMGTTVINQEDTAINQEDTIVAGHQAVIGDLEVTRVVIAIGWDQADRGLEAAAINQDMEAVQAATGVVEVMKVAAAAAIRDTQMISI
jgi:hypothetical protein